MSYDRERKPETVGYFESEDLTLKGPGKWKTTICRFHGGSDSMRVNTVTGAWVCMSCGVKGGDVLAYHMQAHGLDFVEAAKALGAWVDDGKPQANHKPAPLSPRSALEVLGFEATVCAVAAGNLGRGVALSDVDLARLLVCASRITRLVEAFT